MPALPEIIKQCTGLSHQPPREAYMSIAPALLSIEFPGILLVDIETAEIGLLLINHQ